MLECGVLNNGDTLDYACGLIKGNYKGLNTISHGGAFVGFRADIVRFPDQRFTIAIFANRADANPGSMCYKVADILLKDRFQEPEPNQEQIEDAGSTPDPEFSLEQLTGTYIIQAGMSLEIGLQEDSLTVLQNWDLSSYKIARTNLNTFHVPGMNDISSTKTAIGT